MGLGEKLSKFIPDIIKPPLQPASYDEFVNALRAQGAIKVVALPSRKTLFYTGSAELGLDEAGYEYNIAFNAVGRTGRRIKYYLPCAQKFPDNPDYHYAHGGRMRGERPQHDLEDAYSLTTIITADVKLQQLQKLLPDCTTELRVADRTFTQEDYEELRILARQGQIRPWDADTADPTT